MSTFRRAASIPVMSKASAEKVGQITHFVVDAPTRTISSARVEGKKKHGVMVSWRDIVAVGDDAVIVESEEVLRDAENKTEERAARGELTMLDKRVLDEQGDELGVVDDVVFDPASGEIESINVGREIIEGDRLIGVGSYAVVVRTYVAD
jgi:sporulation protein YlmC with PRC-barrel domain